MSPPKDENAPRRAVLTNEQCVELADFLASTLGLDFREHRRTELERGIVSAAKEFGFDRVDQYINWLMAGEITREKIETLAGSLTVGESYFLRDRQSFELLQETIIPEMLAKRHPSAQIRIWSAGCATGEEPYSIAIALDKAMHGDLSHKVSILATDINPGFLKKASAGVYTEWSFRDTPAWLRRDYFRRTQRGNFEIIPRIKNMVRFDYHNLATDIFASLLNDTNALDLISCRNVLMYMVPEMAQKIVDNFWLSLVDGGWLLLAPNERSFVTDSKFTKVRSPNGAAAHRRATIHVDTEESPGPAAWLQKETRQPYLGPKPEPEPQPRIAIQPDERIPTVQETRGEAFELYQKGLYSEAILKISSSFSENMGDVKTMQLMVRAYANTGDLDAALTWTERALASDKLDPANHYLIAIILREQEKYDEAVAALTRAIYLDPDFVIAHFALGTINKHQDRVAESEKNFDNALNLIESFSEDEFLPESEGVTAGRLREIITVLRDARAA